MIDQLSPEEQTILEARATELAQVPASLTEDSDKIEVLTFVLGDEQYALSAIHVREVRPLEQLTPVPCTPQHIMGVVNMHGDILPLVDLRSFLGNQTSGLTDFMSVIVVEANGVKAGLPAQRIGEVSIYSDTHFEDPTINAQGIRLDYLQGMAADGLVLLDLPTILGDKHILVND